MYSGNKCIKQKGPIKMKKKKSGQASFQEQEQDQQHPAHTHTQKNHVPKEEPLICG